MSKRKIRVTEEGANALRPLLEHPKYELIPLKNATEQAVFLPVGATVTVTASPAKGMQATVDLSRELLDLGFDVIPHLSARLTKDRSELEGILLQLDRAGITKAFVVGGDADPPGDFYDGLSLLEAMKDIGHGLVDIGFPAYPEGHPIIPDESLQQALHDKAPFASSMTTQMCFTPDTIVGWLRDQRAHGIDLPVYLGIPGVAELRKLIGISARIGVGDSLKFLTKNTSLVGKLVRPGGYSPDALLIGIADAIADPRNGIRGFHVYTFNQVESTERWRKEMLEELS